MDPAASLRDLDELSLLADRARRRLYEFVAASTRPVRRDEAAAAAGLSRSLAAYHLDRLAAAGLLDVSYGRPPGRVGPGAGRPAKLYGRAERDFVIRTPPRDYPLLAEILLRADQANVRRSARAVGREIGRESSSLLETFSERGYEPYDEDGTLRFHNCPFHRLTRHHRDSVCQLNLALVEGILAGLHVKKRPRLEPGRAGCCVAVG